MKNSWLPDVPLTINWAVTNRCNLKCHHCYSRDDPSDELQLPELLDCIGKVADAGVLSINFGGGEPLLRKDLLEIARFSSDRGMRVSMNSNGYFIDNEKALQLKDAGFKSVGVSIDSNLAGIHDDFRGMKGSHERAKHALSHLRAVGIETTLSAVICRINHKDVDELVVFAREREVRQLNFHNFKCSGLGYSNKDTLDLTRQEWKEFYIKAHDARSRSGDMKISLEDPIVASLGLNHDESLVKGSVCGKLSLNIKANGDISPCGFIPTVLGNIKGNEIRDIWAHSGELKKMRNKVPRGKCVTCSHLSDCLGGCTARALALTGDMNSPDPHCWENES